MNLSNKILEELVESAKRYVPRGGVVYFRGRDSQLSLSFISETYAYKVRKEADLGAEKFGAYISFDVFKNTLRNLKGDESEIEVTSNFLTINNNSSIFKLNTLTSGLTLPKIEFTKSIEIKDRESLNKAIKRYREFASTDELFSYSAVNITPADKQTIVWVTNAITIWGEKLDFEIPEPFAIPGKWVSNIIDFNKIEFSKNWIKYSNNSETLLNLSTIQNNEKYLNLIANKAGLTFDTPDFTISKKEVVPYLNNHKNLMKDSYGLIVNLVPPNSIKFFFETAIYSAEFQSKSQIEFVDDYTFKIDGEYLLKTLNSAPEDDVLFQKNEGYVRAKSNENNFYFLPFLK
jgi:hypothetical protein